MVKSEVMLLYRDFIRVSIYLETMSDDGFVYYITPAPAETKHSFSGSGLPYSNQEQAFYNPIIGAVKQNSEASAIIECRLPNSYYTEVGNKLIRPYMNLSYYKDGKKVDTTIDLNLYIPYRSLYPMINGPMDYAGKFDLPIMNQDKMYRSFAHPEQPMPSASHQSYWGMKPPNG